MWLGLGLVASKTWKEGLVRHWAGKACFGAIFRRPTFSILQEVFHQILVLEERPAAPWGESLDEVLVFTGVIPSCTRTSVPRSARPSAAPS